MNSKITRYMSLGSFISFLKNGLFVPKSTAFNDEWEGLLPLAKLESEAQEEIKELYSEITPWTYISCWHNSLHESLAMWEIYGKSTEAVSIETSLDKLSSAYLSIFPETLAYLDSVDYESPETSGDISLPKGIKSISKAPA